MAKKKKVISPEDIIESIREKQSEIDDLLLDLEDKVIDLSSASDDEDFDEEE
jgi:hypothetical protein